LEDWQEFCSEVNNMLIATICLIIVLIITVILMYLMNVRIKQLEYELSKIRNQVDLADDELARLSHDIIDFKKLRF